MTRANRPSSGTGALALLILLKPALSLAIVGLAVLLHHAGLGRPAALVVAMTVVCVAYIWIPTAYRLHRLRRTTQLRS